MKHLTLFAAVLGLTLAGWAGHAQDAEGTTIKIKIPFKVTGDPSKITMGIKAGCSLDFRYQGRPSVKFIGPVEVVPAGQVFAATEADGTMIAALELEDFDLEEMTSGAYFSGFSLKCSLLRGDGYWDYFFSGETGVLKAVPPAYAGTCSSVEAFFDKDFNMIEYRTICV